MYVRFAELPVIDQDRAIAFYTEKLGFRVAQDRPYQEGWRWIALEIPGARTRVLLTRKTAENTRDGVPSTVDDVHKHYQAFAQKGVVFTTEPTSAPWNDQEVYAVLQDSEDNLIMLGINTATKLLQHEAIISYRFGHNRIAIGIEIDDDVESSTDFKPVHGGINDGTERQSRHYHRRKRRDRHRHGPAVR